MSALNPFGKGEAPAPPAYAFKPTGEGSGADCLTAAAALLLLPAGGGGDGAPVAEAALPQGWRHLAERAAKMIGPGAAGGVAAAELAQVQKDVRAYLAGRLAGWPGAEQEVQQGGVEPLLWALCTEEPHSAGAADDAPGGATLPAYRLALRPAHACAACGWQEEGGEREVHRLELAGADVAATDSVLHSNPKLFDLQK